MATGINNPDKDPKLHGTCGGQVKGEKKIERGELHLLVPTSNVQILKRISEKESATLVTNQFNNMYYNNDLSRCLKILSVSLFLVHIV